MHLFKQDMDFVKRRIFRKNELQNAYSFGA